MLFTDQEIDELRGLIADEGAAFWRTGDWLVRKIDVRSSGGTHNGRDAVVEELARRVDANPQTLRNRYMTSLAFPEGKRHEDVSWTVHRMFAEHGNGFAAVWMNQYRETDTRPSKRRAAVWLSEKTGKQVAEGSSSGSQWAADVARHDDQAAVLTEFVAALDTTGKAALAYQMTENTDALIEVIQCLDEKAGNRRPVIDRNRREDHANVFDVLELVMLETELGKILAKFSALRLQGMEIKPEVVSIVAETVVNIRGKLQSIEDIITGRVSTTLTDEDIDALLSAS